MKLSTEFRSIARLVGDENAIRLLAEAGFEAWDFSLFDMAPYDYTAKCIVAGDHPLQGDGWRAYAENLRRVADACGITCNQSHAPFPTYCPAMHDYLLRSIECTAIVGGDLCVIHPDNYSGSEENAALYEGLLPFAKACGVRIATENTFRIDRQNGNRILPSSTSDHTGLLELLDLVNDPYLVACVDIGHAELEGLPTSACTMIRALGKERLACLHVHDNDKCHDNHALPFTMDLAWEPIAKALAEIGYCGDITLECGNYAKGAAAEAAPTCAEAMAKAAARLREMILAAR